MIQLPISGCYKFNPLVYNDKRGRFIKIYNNEWFHELGILDLFTEEYYTESMQGVIRGMHFQLPPKALTKVVQCIYGNVIDVLLDLRVDSPTYGKYHRIDLDADTPTMVYVAEGIAHGFLTVSPKSMMFYHVSANYCPECDSGVGWNTFGFDWPESTPIISERDNALPSLSGFKSPFKVHQKSKDYSDGM